MLVVRQIDVFDKSTDKLVDEIILSDFDLEAVRDIVNPPELDPVLYDNYEVSGELKKYFEALGFNFNTNCFSYYLCCFQA